MIRPVRRATLTQVVAQQLAVLISNGNLKPGDKLPTERELVRQMAVSRTCVREALRSLEAMNLIRIRQGAGSFVLARDIDIEHLMEARKILEVEIAALVTQRATAEDFLAMEGALAGVESADRDGEEIRTHTIAFHLAVAEASHNPALVKMMSSVRGLMHMEGARLDNIPGRSAVELRSHRLLYEALRTGDPEKARQAMREHIDESLSAALSVGFLEGSDRQGVKIATGG